MLEFLFKYPPDLLRSGVIELVVSWEVFAFIVAAVAAGGPWLLGYFGLTGSGSGGDRMGRTLIMFLRSAVLGLLVFVLMQPQLVVTLETPTRGRVAVLLDDSLSMRIADHAGGERAAYVRDTFAPGDGTEAQALEARFETTYLRFAGDAAPLRDAAELTFDGAVTNLGGALRQALNAPRGLSPHAIVVVTDGGVTGDATIADAIAQLRAADVPVHAVGVGSERFARELELHNVRTPVNALKGDTIEAEVVLTHRGLGGRRVRLTVEDDSLIAAERYLVLPADGDRLTTRMEFALEEKGPHDLTFRLAHQPDEVLTDNNSRRVVVDVRDDRIDVLHVEGEPRFEVKFIRRAVSDDEHIRLVSLVRTSDNKLYRLGVENADELASGFPATPEGLFPFRVVILGSVEANRFSAGQQQLLVDFVSRRGGGLLLLGGRHAFAEGRYGESELAALMPVALGTRADAFRTRVRVQPALHGSNHAVLRMLGSGAWDRLPELSVVNPISRLKPGATSILEGHDGDGPPLVVLAGHRYGRGTVAALPVRDTWRWQMHSSVPVDDRSHETLWRQLLRWLARPASGRVRVALSDREGVVGQSIRVSADVVGIDFQPSTDATVRISIESPIGERSQSLLEPHPLRVGRYETLFTPDESGRYDLELALLEGGQTVAVETAHVYVDSSGREFHDAELDAALLERLARETGGRYYPANRAAGLAAAIEQPEGSRPVVTRLPLWDAPALYILIVVLAGAEWLYRRRRGLR